MSDKIMTEAEWASLSAESRHKVNALYNFLKEKLEQAQKIVERQSKTIEEGEKVHYEQCAKIDSALKEAVTVIYFEALCYRTDYLGALWSIVRILGGDEARELLEHNERAAFEKYAKPESDKEEAEFVPCPHVWNVYVSAIRGKRRRCVICGGREIFVDGKWAPDEDPA